MSKISKRSLGETFSAVEAEVAVQILEDLPIKNDLPFEPEDVLRNIKFVIPAIELCATRASFPLNPSVIVADFALNAKIILGQRRYVPSALLSQSPLLETCEGSIIINDSVVGSALTSNVLGSPILSLTWLANELAKTGNYLRADDIVMTGAICAHRTVRDGDKIRAKFLGLSLDGQPDIVSVDMYD
jgi:2-keto-4-pentenoate hydratase